MKKLFEISNRKRDGTLGRKLGVFKAKNKNEAAEMGFKNKYAASQIHVVPVKIVKAKDKRKRVILYE